MGRNGKRASLIGHISNLVLAAWIVALYWGLIVPSSTQNGAFIQAFVIFVALSFQIGAIAGRRLSGDKETTSDNLVSMIPLAAMLVGVAWKGFTLYQGLPLEFSSGTGILECKIPEGWGSVWAFIISVPSMMEVYLWWNTLFLLLYFYMDLVLLAQIMNRLLLTTDEAIVSRFR